MKSRLWLVLGGVGMASLTMVAVFAVTTPQLLPQADGHYQSWTPNIAAPSHASLVDDFPCDDINTYNYTTTVGGRDSYVVDISSIPSGSIIRKIVITGCAARHNLYVSSSTTVYSTSTLKFFYRFNGVDSADAPAGGYSLGISNGTYPMPLTQTSPNVLAEFSGLSYLVASTSTSSTLEIGAIYVNGTGGARLSNIYATTTYDLPVVPAAPTNLTATQNAVNLDQIDLSWRDNANNETGFLIERGAYSTNFVQIAAVGPGVTTYSDVNLPAGRHYYRVRAVNWSSYSSYSNIANAVAELPLF